MKKFVTLSLALLLVLALVAAQAVVSPAPVIKFWWELENPEADPNNAFFFMVTYDENKHIEAQKELRAIAEAEYAEDYFGDAAAEALAITGGEDLTVTELAPVVAGNYKPEMGTVKLGVACPTLYEDGQTVAVLFKINDEWTVFEGTGNEAGEVVMTLDGDTIQAVQDNGALMVIAI